MHFQFLGFYSTNQCLPRHTFNKKPIHPLTHNYIPHTRIESRLYQTRLALLHLLSSALTTVPELHPTAGVAALVVLELAPPHLTSRFVLISVYCLISYFPKLWVSKFWWVWVIFWISISSYWYGFCWFSMDFAFFLSFFFCSIFIGFGWILKW